MLSAEYVDAKKILVKTGRGLKSFKELSNSVSEELKADYVTDNVVTVVEWILIELNMKSS